jgi:hypothetical protein
VRVFVFSCVRACVRALRALRVLRARVRACLAVAEFCETLPIPLRQKFSFFQKEKHQSRCMRMQTGTHMVPKHPWMWQARIRDDTHELVQNMLGADGGRRGPPWANP